MGLSPNDKLGGIIRGAARGIFRVSIVARALKDGLAFLQAYAHGDPDDPDNQELLGEADVDHVSHFGFSSSPPADTEAIVVEADGGECSLGERDSLEDLDTHGTADEMPALATGDTCIYSQDGTYIFLDSSGKLTIKAMTDNVEVITEAGKQIKLGQDGATYRDIAYAHKTEAGASQVAVATGLKAYMDKIDADLAAIKTDMTNIDALLVAAGTLTANVVAINGWIATHAPAPGVGPVLGPPGAKAASTLGPTTAALAVDIDHSYVSSGSDKAEVEP
jgi:phage gp45-like